VDADASLMMDGVVVVFVMVAADVPAPASPIAIPPTAVFAGDLSDGRCGVRSLDLRAW